MKKILALIIAIILIFVSSACGKKTQNETEGNKNNGTQNIELSDNELAIFSYKPDTFCPIISLNNANLQMLNIVFEGLVSLDDKMIPQSCLAESWTISGDGLEWNVKLREGIKWHSGSIFSARDVVYTVNQIKNNPGSLYSYNTGNIETVSAQGQNNVVFKLFEPNPNFISLLYFPIVKYSDSDIDRENYTPDGTGAYKFEDRNEGNVYYLVRNESWWNGKAASDEIKVKLLPDKETAFYAFNSAGIDMTVDDDFTSGKSINSKAALYADIKTPIYSFIGINHTNPVLAMKEVRGAISYALDRNKLIEDTMMKRAVAAKAPTRDEWFVCGENIFDYKQNTKLAHEKLLKNGWEMAESKYQKNIEGKTSSLKFEILINEDNLLRVNMAHAIEKSLEEFGMDITVVSVPYETYIERINSGQYDAFIGSYVMSADVNIGLMFNQNIAFGFQDDGFTAALSELKSKTTQEETVKAYTKIINRFNELNPVIGLMFENHTMIYNSTLSGEINPSYYGNYNGIENISVKGDDTK